MRFLKYLLVLLLVTPVHAELISYPPQKIMGFRGLDTESNAPLIPDGRAEDMTNVKISTSFDITKRFGYSVVNDTLDDDSLDSPPITGIFDATFSDTAFPIAFVGDKVKYDSGSAWTDIGTPNYVTENKDYQWVCTMALDTAVCTNDFDLPVAITSTPTIDTLDVSDLSDTLTKAKAIAWFRNYLIFGNTVEGAAEKPTRIRWSNVGTTETWTDDDFNDLAELGGDEINGFAELYGNLYAFLEDSIYKITLIGGDDVFSYNKIVSDIGAIAKDSIQVVRLNNDQSAIIFLDEDKRVYMFNGLLATDIGKTIQPTLNLLNESRLQFAVSAYDEDSYYLSVSNSGSSTNDLLLEYNVWLGEWSKHDQIDANAMARVRDSSLLKTYFGNYKAFVYWMDNPDLKNDVNGGTGVVDSVDTISTATITGAQQIIDSDLASGSFTGATIKITGGTASGEEQVIISGSNTSVIVASAFSTTPDNTSVYSIGAIEANYKTRWFDLGDSARKKNFKEMYFWAREGSSNEIVVSYAQDFGTTISSETENLSPTSSSLWDTALWDTGVWGTAGDKLYRIKLKGNARTIQLGFENNDIDETFKIYGFNILADGLDIR